MHTRNYFSYSSNPIIYLIVSLSTSTNTPQFPIKFPIEKSKMFKLAKKLNVHLIEQPQVGTYKSTDHLVPSYLLLPSLGVDILYHLNPKFIWKRANDVSKLCLYFVLNILHLIKILHWNSYNYSYPCIFIFYFWEMQNYYNSFLFHSSYNLVPMRNQIINSIWDKN